MTTLINRLEDCAERAGGKRALAQAAGFSEAQLFRYLRGDSAPDAEKLLAIAKAAKVDAGWLLTGREAPTTDSLALPHNMLLHQTILRTFEESMLEVNKPLPPAQRAQFIDMIYTDALLEWQRLSAPYPQEFLTMIFKIHFLYALKAEGLTAYNTFILQDVQSKTMSGAQLESLTNHIARANVEMFNTQAGQFFYDRVGRNVWPSAAKRLDEAVLQAMNLLGKRTMNWLDMGCGNGRELSYLHRHYENVAVHGLDNSELCIDLCRQQADAGNIPSNAVEQADARFLPYPADSFDVVYSRRMLDSLPYFPNESMGLNQLFKQVRRVLRPQGVFLFSTRYGQGREYVYFQQLLAETDIEHLAAMHGFQIKCNRRVNFLLQENPQAVTSKFDDWLDVVLQKI
ncbi:MAG: methyltransferase domain-containing protein [Alphaproteobacteria bacterium]